MSQHAAESQNNGTKPSPGLRSQTTSVEISSLSVASDVNSRGTHSTLGRATSAPLPGEYLEQIQISATPSVQLPGSLTPGLTGWIYKASLVDKWAFLAKTALIVHRLRARPSDENIMQLDRTQTSEHPYLPQDSSQISKARSTGSGALGDLPPGEPLEAASPSLPTSHVASRVRSLDMGEPPVGPGGIMRQLAVQQLPPQLPPQLPSVTAAPKVTSLMPAVPAVAVAASKATAAAPAAAEPRVATSGGPQRTVSADVSKVLSALLAQVEQETSLPPPAAATSAASKGTAGTTPEAKGHGTVTAPRAEFPVGVNDGAVVMTGGESLQPSKDSTPAVKGGANPEARSDTSTAFSSTYSTHEQAQTNKPPCSTADIDNLLAELLADVSASVMRAPAAHPASTSPSASGSAKQSDQPSQQLSAFNQDAAKAKSLLSSSQPVSPGTLELGAGTAGMADFECAEPAEHAEQVMLGVDEEIAGLISSADVPEGSRSHSVVPDVRPANGTALQQTLDMVTDTVMERLVAGAEAGQQPASHMATAMDSGRHGMPSMAAGLNSEQHSTPSTTGGISNVQHSKASTAAAPLLPQADSSLELLHESAGTKSVGHALLGLDEEMAGLAPPEVAEPAGPAMLDLDDEMAGLAPPEHAEPAKPAVLGLHEDMAGRGGASDTLKAAATSGITKEGSDEAERVSADVNEAVANLTDAVIKAENAAGVQQNTGSVVKEGGVDAVDGVVEELMMVAMSTGQPVEDAEPPMLHHQATAEQIASSHAKHSTAQLNIGHSLNMDAEIAGLIAAAEAAPDQSHHSQLPGAAPSSRLTADDDDTQADLTPTAVAAAGQPDASAYPTSFGVEDATDVSHHTVPSSRVTQLAGRQVAVSSTFKGLTSKMLDLDAEMACLAASEDAEPAEHAMLDLDAEMAGLASPKDAEPAEPAEHAMLDLDAEMAGLAAFEDAEPAEHAMLDQHEDMAGVLELAAGAVDASHHTQSQAMQSSRLSADIDATVEDVASSAIAAAAQAHADAPSTSAVTVMTDHAGMFSLSDEMSGLLAAAMASQDEVDHKHSHTAQPSCITADIDDVLSDLTSSAVAAAPQPVRAIQMSSAAVSVSDARLVQQSAPPETPLLGQTGSQTEAGSKNKSVDHALLDLDEEMAGLAAPEHAAPAEPAVLGLHEDMAGLGAPADAAAAGSSLPPHMTASPPSGPLAQAGLPNERAADPDATQHGSPTGHVAAVARVAQATLVTADVDSVIADLISYASRAPPQPAAAAAAAVGAAPTRITADVDQKLEDLVSSAVSHASSPSVQATAVLAMAQRSHVTADVDAAVADLSASAASHAAWLGESLPAAVTASEAAAAAVESDSMLDDSYEDDAFDDLDPAPHPEAAAEAAVSPDVPLDSFHEADALETAEEAERVIPERPASPVAMQLAAAAAAATSPVSATHDKSAPASLAGDQGVADDHTTQEDDYEDDIFEADPAAQTDSKSEDGLVGSALQAAGEEEVGSSAGSDESSDLDDVTQDDGQTHAEQAASTRENKAFEAEQSELQTQGLQSASSGEHSSYGDQSVPEASLSPALDSAARSSEAQVSPTAVASVPKPPPQRNASDVRLPARPSRAFMRHAISMTKPDGEASSRAGPLAAAPLPATPQAPAGGPPRHRARQHPPLGHQVSHSGKGSIGQPPRIEAFWPALGDPYKMGPTPPQGATPRSESRGKKRSPKKRAFVTSLREVPGVGSRSPGDESEMVDLQELGRPVGSDGGAPEKKSPAGVQLTRHLEYDILQCIAKNRPEHLSWLVVKARQMGVRPSNAAVAAANTICKLTRRQAVPKAPPLLTEELRDMRASLMALDNIYHRHSIMPGAVRSSPTFDNAWRALQRLTLDNEAAAAVATGDWQAMEQVLEVARAHNNSVVVRRLEASLNKLEAEASGAPSTRSMRTPRALEGALRLRDLASPVRPRSRHPPPPPPPGRGQVPQEVLRRLEEHDDQQAAVHLAWLAQKDEQRRRHQAQATSKKLRLPDWYLQTAALRPRIDSHDFAAWRESHADALQEKSADQMSMMYIQTVEAELRRFRHEYMRRYNYARELNWHDDHVYVKRQLFDDTLEKQPSNTVVSTPYTTNSSRAY